MAKMKFSDDFLNTAYKMVASSMCESDLESQMFGLVCEICDKYGVSTMKFMLCLNELNRRLAEAEQENQSC